MKYLVTFENIVMTMTEEELLNFVKVAVISNKDISKFQVQRIANNEIEQNGNIRLILQ